MRRTVAVTGRALIQRINRALVEEGRMLRKTRGSRALQDLGEYYVLNVDRNWVIETDVDLEAFGRKLGCLEAYERLG